MARNKDLANIFEQIADLMEITGEQPFRINSYRRAARIIEDLPRDVADLLADGELANIPGIGKGTVQRIESYLHTGAIPVHDELLAKVPPGLLHLLDIPGMGPKTVSLVWKTLGVEDIDGLNAAIDDGRLAELPGMGAKKVERLRDGIQFLSKTAGRTPLGIALPIAELLAQRLSALPTVRRVELAGSLRRRCETIGDLDLLVQADDGKTVLDAFTQFDEITDVLAAGSTKASVRVKGNVQVDVRVVPAASFGAAWQYFTGSKAHNVRLRELAVRRKWKLNEYGLFSGKKTLAGKNEEGIYDRLKLPWIAPELREDRGEIEHADQLGKLIELDDIRGDMHMHTDASDGACTITEMIEACIQRGYEYLCISDHSTSSRIANGLDDRRLKTHIKNIRKTAEKYRRQITVLASAEVDILADGKLDYDDALLAELDLAIASIHSALRQPSEKITTRLLKAMDNPHVRIIGHPTGRLIGQRDASDVDIAAVIHHAAQTNTFLELNASWQRLDLKDVHLHQAKQAGVKIAIATDAHSIDQLDYIRFGLYTARRGWLQADDVINTLPAKTLVPKLKAAK